MASELPRVGGVFIQMEDEIASMGAVIGASMGGAKAMTATSGPGFSLKQENLGYAAGAEVPCVIINVMRGGPSTGMPTRPAQGEVMQARWGTHSDHPIIVLTPASVREVFDQTVRAFNLSERYRVPVVVLVDEVVGHLIETVALPDSDEVETTSRKWADGAREDFKPYEIPEDGIPVMARPGQGYRSHTTGLTHDATGFPTQEPGQVEQVMTRLLTKLDQHRDDIEQAETLHTEDAEVLVIGFGIVGRAALSAVNQARDLGIRAGMLRPITLWPFPERTLRSIAANTAAVVVAEMNAGQLCLEVERLCPDTVAVIPLNRIDGEPIEPRQILAAIEAAAGSMTNSKPTSTKQL
jgi:2-oxoglutarate ferredoxin oxidoreductase subunit alpha